MLETLLEQRLVQRVDVGDGVARYEPAQADGHHHHHLVCDDCGRVQPFSDDTLERALERTAGKLGYAMDTHEVVLRGACGDCRRDTRAPRAADLSPTHGAGTSRWRRGGWRRRRRRLGHSTPG